jgi:hypothetical protein
LLDIGKTVEHNKNYLPYYLLLKATSFDPAMEPSSGNEQELEK